jgi:hypothetical protein
MKLFLLLLASTFVFATAGEAHASMIDFRTVAFTVGGANPDHAPLAEVITFWDALGDPIHVQLEKIFLTDLFNEDGYLEQGWYDLNDDGVHTNFLADPASGSGSNGVRTLVVDQPVHAISFGAPGRINGQDHEFSVAALEFDRVAPIAPTPVPEPSSAALFAIGAALIGRAVRRAR